MIHPMLLAQTHQASLFRPTKRLDRVAAWFRTLTQQAASEPRLTPSR